MASTSAGKNSPPPCSSRTTWPTRRGGIAWAMMKGLDLEFGDQRQVVGHAPPDAATGNLHAHGLEAARIDIVQLRERQACGVGQLALAEKILEAQLVHRRAQFRSPVV